MQTLEQPKLENITLYYREGSSDKVYQAGIERARERFVVNFAYGRRGTTLNAGTKTNVPVEYEQARHMRVEVFTKRWLRPNSRRGLCDRLDSSMRWKRNCASKRLDRRCERRCGFGNRNRY